MWATLHQSDDEAGAPRARLPKQVVALKKELIPVQLVPKLIDLKLHLLLELPPFLLQDHRVVKGLHLRFGPAGERQSRDRRPYTP